ncbi:LacI family DNA-binding transcriptional regulator [Oceanotoga teriensis]|uniref:LacI family DNA-binding transcriptional regulator n=1 Tax=Oceanotoga teriensis TaxID=515440 RepID=UPI002712A5FD|nr:LacI family DNA-binding transcriptional regulator [Oceanotoga teriensis]MDO7975998.1 LacI family transcriptional regulator [Oceanotoga teriensis]
MATIRDISKYSGISIATISRVLNAKGNVSEETRKKVLKAIKDLGYTRTDMIKKTAKKVIGIIAPGVGIHYSLIIEGIEEELKNTDYQMFIATTAQAIKKEQAIIDEFMTRKIDGFIICTSKKDDEYIEKLIQSAIPVVVVDRQESEINTDSVSIDNYTAGQKAVEYLYEKGHRKILFIDGYIYSHQPRKKAFIDFAKKKKDITLYIEQGGVTPKEGYKATKNFMKQKKDITAIFYVNDWQAMGGIKALTEEKINIPEDISVMGFDNDNYGNYLNPSLTTIHQPRKEIGMNAANLLIERIEHTCKSKVKRKILLPTKIIERESVKDISEGKIC